MQNSKEKSLNKTEGIVSKSSLWVWKTMFSYALKHKISLFFVAVFSVAEAVVSVISPKVAGKGVTALSQIRPGIPQSADMENVFQTLTYLVVLYSIFAICSCVGRYMYSYISVNITYRLREETAAKINKVSLKYIGERSRGDVLSCIVNDVEAVSSGFIESIRDIISSLIVGVGTFFMMLSISPAMTWSALAVIPVMAILIIFIVKKSQKYFVEYQSKLASVNGVIEETFSGYETIKLYGGEKKFLQEFNSLNGKMYSSSVNAQFFSGFGAPVMSLLSNVTYIISCIMGGYFAITKGFAIGNITAFIAYSGQLTGPLTGAMGVVSGLQKTSAAAGRVFEFLNAPEEVSSDNCAAPESVEEITDIEFKNVSFEYEPGKPVIKNFSFKIKSGQTVAVVGETGAGKTTLINLILRFYNVTEGEILLNGRNIRLMNIEKYRKIFGAVTQEPWLQSATVMENIRYGNLKASDDDVIRAAKFVGAHHFIKSLEKGYRTYVKEGMSNLSQGQKQLICIARAVISNCKILVLDEATASVDTFTESCLQKALSKLFRGRTSLIIAHRLSTIRHADVILVMDNGVLKEYGNHEDLMLKKGFYYDMITSAEK